MDLAKIRVYGTVSDHGIIGSSMGSKGKGTATATATGSVFSVLETEDTAFGLVSCFATFAFGRCIRRLVVNSSGVGGASVLASFLATFACRSTIVGVRVPGRGGVVVIIRSRVVSGARIAIRGHCGLKNFKIFVFRQERATYVNCIVHRAMLRDCNEEGHVIR